MLRDLVNRVKSEIDSEKKIRYNILKMIIIIILL